MVWTRATQSNNKIRYRTSRRAPTGHKLLNHFSTSFSVAPVGGHQTFGRKSMPLDPLIYATTEIDMSAEAVLLLAEDLIDALGVDRFDEGCLSVNRVLPIDYDSGLPSNLPRTRTVIEVSTDSPFYGKQYARGTWPELASILEFLRYRIPASDVWYGDDCSDEVTLATHEFIANLWTFWAHNANRPYFANRIQYAEQDAPSDGDKHPV